MTKQIEVAIAIIYQSNQFLMQLRDDIPTIRYPGKWGLFGGHIELGETPEIALIRELKEEINLDVEQVQKFGIYPDNEVLRHVFSVPLNVDIEQLTLNEGWDFKLISPTEIKEGKAFSSKAGIKPLGERHQQILLDFIREH